MALVFSSPLITLIIEWFASHFSMAKKWAIQFISAFVLLAGVFFVIQPPFMNLNKIEIVSTGISIKFTKDKKIRESSFTSWLSRADVPSI